MKVPSIEKYRQKSPQKVSERATLLGEFHTKLTEECGEGYKPPRIQRVAMLLAPIKTKDLYSFLAECRYASHFSKYFWSRFKK